LFLNTPKWLFISGPSHLAHAKRKGKTTPHQGGLVPGHLASLKQCRPKIINFYGPQKYSKIYRPPEIGHMRKPLKIIQNQT
jgi:hypothetical protein